MINKVSWLMVIVMAALMSHAYYQLSQQKPRQVRYTEKKFTSMYIQTVMDLSDPGGECGWTRPVKDINWESICQGFIHYLANFGDTEDPQEIVIEVGK